MSGFASCLRESVPNRGEILRHIALPCELRVFDTIDSTNTYAKNRYADAAHGSLPLCVAAGEQTAGRGRLGRSFHSPGGSGIYLSAAVKKVIDPADVPLYTMGAAVQAARAVETVTGASPLIKWVNDLYLNGLKICGILTEAVTPGSLPGSSASPSLLVIGVGINCFSCELPEELCGIAGAVSDEPGSFSVNALAGTVLDGLLRLIADPDPASFMDEYRRRCFITGADVSLSRFDGTPPVKAHVLGVADDGALIVRYLEGPLSGREARVSSGEVTLHSASLR